MIIILTLCICGGSGSDDGIIVTVIFPHSVFVVVYYVCLYHLLRISVLFFTYFCIIDYVFLYYNLVFIMYSCIIYIVFLYHLLCISVL